MADAKKALKRLTKELARIKDDAENAELYSAGPSGDNMLEWTGTIMGPADTPYEDGVFILSIVFPPEYPFKPPKVQFKTKIYHCNIDGNGDICLGILKTDNWAPATSMPTLMMQLRALLETPNPDDPLNAEIAAQYTSDKEAHDAKAREVTAAGESY